MAYINMQYTQRIHVPVGTVEHTVDLGIERDSRWSTLTLGTALPEAHGGGIPAVSRTVTADPYAPGIESARGAVHDAMLASQWIEQLTVETPASGPSTYTWREQHGTELKSSTTPPAPVAALADALAALYAAAPH